MSRGIKGSRREPPVMEPKTLVTYNVDVGVSYQEKVKQGETVLSPTSFTPTKDGWTFYGWTNISTTTNSILSVKTAEGDTMTLYAVFYRTVTITYSGNGNTGGSTAASTGTAYYHGAGGSINASISVRANGFTKTNYFFYRWRLNSTSGTAYSPGSTYASTSDATMYAEWLGVLNIYAGTWSVYSSSPDPTYGSVSASGKVLTIRGYSIAGGNDYYSSGGYRSSVAISAAYAGRTLSYSFTLSKNNCNYGTIYIYLYDNNTKTYTTIKTVGISGKSSQAITGTYTIPNTGHTYYVCGYGKNVGQRGEDITGYSYGYLTCNSCSVS